MSKVIDKRGKVMPLSKKANRERMKQVMIDKRMAEFRLQQLNPSPYQPNALQSTRGPLEGESNTRLSANPQIDADGKVMP